MITEMELMENMRFYAQMATTENLPEEALKDTTEILLKLLNKAKYGVDKWCAENGAKSAGLIV